MPTTTEYDFDGWSEADEEKAIAALVPDVKYIIVERRFIGRFPDGTVVELPLSLTLDQVDEFTSTDQTPVDQFRRLLTEIGGGDTSAKFGQQDLAAASILAEKFFRTLQRVQQAAFPES